MLEAIGGVIASNRSVEGWDIHSTAPCISPHYFTLLFYLCLKILLEALSIDFYFFFKHWQRHWDSEKLIWSKSHGLQGCRDQVVMTVQRAGSDMRCQLGQVLA